MNLSSHKLNNSRFFKLFKGKNGLVSYARRSAITKMIFNMNIVIFLFTVHFLIQFFFGTNNNKDYKTLCKKLDDKKQKLSRLKIENDAKEREINLIRGIELDLDYLDELARAKLNYSSKGEKVLIYSNNQKSNG